VHVHGGPAGVYANTFPASWGNYGHVWAGRGWLVFYPNPRGSSGYGERFLLANVRDWGGGDYHDIQTGVDALVAKGLADPARMGQTGWSYGGYMTAWTLTQTDRFKAVMVGAGLTNMYSMYSTNDLQRTLEGYFGAEPWNDFDVYWNRSAMKFIKQARTPTLIMHGAADERVPLGQAQELYMGLKKNGVPVELAVYPREPHGLQEPRHQLDKMTREYAWFARHVLGEPAAPTGQPEQARR
jgi:dipeptidyl aminopeptidase/acylaminoacyl peptidase